MANSPGQAEPEDDRMNLAPFFPFAKPWLTTYQFFHRFFQKRSGFRVLTFHDVPVRMHPAFERIIKYVLDHHGILSPCDVESILNGTWTDDLERTPCLITFDDGFLSNAEVAREILARYGIQALFFVCPSLLELPPDQQPAAVSRAVFEDAVPESEDMRLMSWEDLEMLLRAGHTIGSHTRTHRRLSSLSRLEKGEEIIKSAEVLERRLGIACNWFAYPFGSIQSIDAESYEIIGQRHRFCCAGLRGINSPGISRLALRRDPIELHTPFEYQLLSLCGGLDFLYRRGSLQLKKYARIAEAQYDP